MGVSKKYNNAPPRTAMEVYEMLPPGTLAEVMNNTVCINPAPPLNTKELSLICQG